MWTRRVIPRALLVVGLGLSASAALRALPAWAAGSCTFTTCNAPTPTCATPTTTGTDNCGFSCTLTVSNSCSAPTPTCATPTTTGTMTCGGSCQRTYGDSSCSAPTPTCATPVTTGTRTCGGGSCQRTLADTCSAVMPTECGRIATGTYLCSGLSCSVSSAPCSGWQPYGFVQPGDPVYGFPNILNSSGTGPFYPAPQTRSLVGLVAKGNIVVGDYTSPAFQTQVVPNIDAGATAKTRPYAVDPTDDPLGYHTGAGGVPYDANGRPLFDGNYTQQDRNGLSPGVKLDDTPRRFYESTLSDAQFRSLVSMPTGGSPVDINGVLFTNHVFTGVAPAGVTINGAIVARDEALMYGSSSDLTISHDQRLAGGAAASPVGLPYSLQRPPLMRWVECTAAGCP